METTKKLTREQQRFIDKLNKEAATNHANLTEKFFNFFMDSDNPEGPEIEEKILQLSAQWKTYCQKRRLNKGVIDSVELDCRNLVKQFQDNKKPKEVETV
jgi:hypothetical protein